MAEQLWPRLDPLGKRIRLVDSGPQSPWVTVVGVVGRVKQYALDEDSRIALYLPQSQYPARSMNVVLKSERNPLSEIAEVTEQVRELDRDLPIYHLLTMQQRVAESLARRRFSTLLMMVFAGLAMLMAAIGIYGVIAYLVNQGTREIGIRMALGATPANILGLVTRAGMLLALAGVTAGTAGAFGLTRWMRSMLYGVAANDPLTFLTIPLLLGGIALLASYIPAQRAARLDPMISLRSE
jgi:ABC-type antimicrobial peptide transport system permease subunit